MHHYTKNSHRPHHVACLLLLSGALVYALPCFAAGQGLDVTISVAGPSQDLPAMIEHEIALPESARRVQGDLLHRDGHHEGGDVRGDAGSDADPSKVIGQSESLHQETGPVEQQSQELLNQAQQSAQTMDDQGGDSD